MDNKTSVEICNLVCPNCQRFDGAADPKAIGCKRTDPACVNGGLEVRGGWGVTVPLRHDMPLGGHFYDIQLIYYGIPKNLPPRSKLSDNNPKNTDSGDPRECEVSRCNDSATTTGDPIDVLTGNFDYSYTDLSLNTVAGKLTLQRTYASQATDTVMHPTSMSPGWSHNQDARLLFEGDQVWFKAHTINQYRFDVVGDHVYDPYNGVLAELTYEDGQYILITSSQSVYIFDSSGRLLTWTNERGHGFIYTYSGGELERVTEPVSGRYLQFNYMGGFLQSVSDSAGRQASYSYDANDDLDNVTDVRGNTWGYQYDGDHRITTVLAPGTPPGAILSIVYDGEGRAYEQYNGAGNRLTHIDFNPDGSSTSTDTNGIPTHYTPDCNGVVTRTEFPGSAVLPGYFVDRAYDHNFNLTSVRASNDEKATNFRWSMDGANLVEMTDQAGYITHFTYDADNHVTRVDAPGEDWISYNYTGPLITSTTESSSLGDVTTSYTYTTSVDAPQPVNLLKTTTDALGNVTSFEYDAIGQLNKITDADLNETHFTYDATGQLTTITDALGRVAQMEFDASGAVTKLIDNFDSTRAPNDENQYNLSTSYEYDLLGRLTITRNTLDEITSTTLYDDAGRIHQILDATGNPVTYVYNQDGTVDSVTIAPDFVTSYDYDDLGRVTAIHDSLGQFVSGYSYNPDNTLASETDAAGLVTNYVYDALHRITQVSDNAGHAISTSYDAYGDVTSVIDAMGRVTKYEYSDPGRLTRVIENFLANPPYVYDPNATNVTTEYSYDILGNLTAVLDANDHITTYNYDNLYRLDTITDPLSHVTDYGYDALGNRISITRPDGGTTSFAYDLVNRLTGVDYPGGDVPDVSYTYNSLSQLTGMDDSLGHTAWQYDPLGQPILITDPYDHSIAYAYDTLGNRTQLNYPGGRTIHYQYNNNGMLEHVLDGSSLLVDYAYDPAGRLLSADYANGVSSSFSYDLSSQLTGLKHQLPDRDLALYDHTYDLSGNLIQTRETLYNQTQVFLPALFTDTGGLDGPELFDPGIRGLDGAYPAPDDFNFNPDGMGEGYPAPVLAPLSSVDTIWDQIADFFADIFTIDPVSATSTLESSTPDQIISYTYDALNRLKTASYLSGDHYAYEYDQVGNRTAQTINGMTISYIYDIANRLTSVDGVNYTWDDNGSLLNDGLMNYSYDPAGRLAGITSAYGNYQFGYDGLGNRYTQTAGGETVVYSLDLAAGLTTVLREGTTTYLYGLGLIGQETGGALDIALADRLGSIRQLVDEDQQVTLTTSYDPFGNTLFHQGESSSAFGFTGEGMDESGLVFLRARYYSPETGRFISADPFPGVL
ncbi:MAG: RHS repeat protein, partial [Anaerolineaceae bacterium]|nr:RHS repeat protein [Anaerolineaceae bacterium]